MRFVIASPVKGEFTKRKSLHVSSWLRRLFSILHSLASEQMGKFLRNKGGEIVAIRGAPVLEKHPEKKPRDCQECGFSRWAKGDKLFILGGNQWVCPDCAVQQGLPSEHYHRNAYATQPPPPSYNVTPPPDTTRRQSGFGDLVSCICLF
jgi:hypothetical protein